MKGIAPSLLLPPAWLAASSLGAWGLLGAYRFRDRTDTTFWWDPGVFLLVAALGLLMGILIYRGGRLTSDGYDHFVYLRSLWIDHDLDLANDYEALSPRGHSIDPKTPLGRTGNLHPIGPALAWAPFYLLADLLCRVTGRIPDGQNTLYRNAVAIAGLLYGWVGLLVLYRTGAERAGRGAALLATFGIAFGTFLFFYLAFSPTMAHAPGFGAVALCLALWLREPPWGVPRASLLGAAIGGAALMRWSNALLVVLPGITLLVRLFRKEPPKALLGEAAALGCAAALVFSPQMVVWKLLYGSFLTVPQGPGFLARAPAYAGVLFSPWHGLFSWSPLLYAGFLGLVPFLFREPSRGGAIFLFLGLLLRVNASTADWWGGAAFGGRRFDSALPFLGLGLALAFAGLYRFSREYPLVLPLALLGGFIFWNVGLAVAFNAGLWDVSEPVTFEEMGEGVASLVDRTIGSPFSLPGSFFDWLARGTSPKDFEASFAERRHSRFSVRMGLDDQIYLEGGWSPRRVFEGQDCRLVVGDSFLVIPLHRPEAYRLGIRIRATDPNPSRIRVLVSDAVMGSVTAGEGWKNEEMEIPDTALRPGRNLFTFRALGSPVAVAGVWLEPLRSSEQDR